MTRTLVISMLASFVAGGTAVWLLHRAPVIPAPGAPLSPPLSPVADRPSAPSSDAAPPASTAGGSAPTAIDPRAALTAALNIPNSQKRRSAVRQVAETAARVDPKLGSELANAIGPESLRSDYFRALYLEWARVDPFGFLAAMPPLQSSQGTLLRQAEAAVQMDALKLASESDPIRAFEIGGQYGGARGQVIRAAALEALAAINPAAAIDRYREFDGLAASALALQSIATGYARADLDAAVDWLPTIDSNRGIAYRPIIEALALVDLPRAIELDAEAMELGFGGSSYGDNAWLARGLRSGNTEVVQVADLLWRTESRNLLAEALAWWIRDDPYGTVAWIHTKETISSRAVSRIAGDIGARDLMLALNLGDQFSDPVRARWMEQALTMAAQYDPVAALRALETFSGASFHADAFASVIARARQNIAPTEIAALIGRSPPPESARRVAFDWAEADPVAAANWALSLDPPVRSVAVSGMVQGWHELDAAAAYRWALDHPDAGIPDDVIASLCRAAESCSGQ